MIAWGFWSEFSKSGLWSAKTITLLYPNTTIFAFLRDHVMAKTSPYVQEYHFFSLCDKMRTTVIQHQPCFNQSGSRFIEMGQNNRFLQKFYDSILWLLGDVTLSDAPNEFLVGLHKTSEWWHDWAGRIGPCHLVVKLKPWACISDVFGFWKFVNYL